MAKTVFFIFLLMICFFPATSPAGTADPLDFDPPWKLATSENDTQIYKHPWPGHDIHACKADTIIAAPLSKVLNIILDVESYPEWIPQSKHVKIIKKEKPDRIIYHMSMDFPWPASDRDWVNELVITSYKENDHITITTKAKGHLLPRQKNHIRVTDHYGSWTLIAIGPNRTRSIWQWNTDPGGHLPAWLIEWASQSQVLESLERIKEKLKQ